MKAIAVHQPYASLIACGAKTIETRHHRRGARLLEGQRIAIHATLSREALWVCEHDPFAYVLRGAGHELVEDLPRGAIVATAVLDRCVEMTEESIAATDPLERAFGFYAVGRFAWCLRDVVALDKPVPFKGRQGIFIVPDELLEAPSS